MRACNAVCKQCPFMEGSAQGWLGGATVQETLDFMQHEFPFTCHLHRDEDTNITDTIAGKYPICRGFLLSASKSHKLFGSHPQTGKELARLQAQVEKETQPEEWGEVLSRREFAEYHKPK